MEEFRSAQHSLMSVGRAELRQCSSCLAGSFEISVRANISGKRNLES